MGSPHEKPQHGFGGLLSGLQEAYESGRTKDLAWRRAQLKGLLRLLTEEEEEIFVALHDDLGKHRAESYRDELGALVKSVNHTLKNLTRWAAPEKAQAPLVSFPATALVVPEPLGVVLVFSCWNLPLGLALEPLTGALAAGNVVVVKPSELAPSTAAFLAANIPKYLDPKAVKIILGGPEVGEQLMEHRWDKVLFTGSANVGRIILTKAAKHLTPVALELGSKCPCIVDQLDSKRDRQIAVNRITGAKWSVCAGQACVAIDYILVEENFAPILVELLKSTVKRFTSTPECMARILNAKHFHRLSNFLDDDRVARSVVHGGSVNHKTLTIEPTILLNPPLNSDIMTEEIFGPLLPIITVKKIEDSIKFVTSMPKPLAIYAFTKNEELKHRIINETSSGSITFNDAIVQVYKLIHLIPPNNASVSCSHRPAATVMLTSSLVAVTRLEWRRGGWTEPSYCKLMNCRGFRLGRAVLILLSHPCGHVAHPLVPRPEFWSARDASYVRIDRYVVEGLPFGGVGQSGFGQYHGKYSFELFSNKKAVFKRSFLIEFMFRYPPWDDSKIGMLRHVFNTNYILLLLGLLGLRR